MRGVIVVTLFALAGLLSVISNVGLWVDRTVYDTDTFVTTTDDVLEDEDVQEVVARRFADELYVAADVDTRLQAELPEGLKFLALPLSNAARDFLYEATLRLLKRQPFEDFRNEALRRTHAQLISTIEGENNAVQTEDGALVIDLRPVLERVAEDVTGRDVDAPREGGAEAPEIPPDVLERLPDDVRQRLEGGEGGLLQRLDLSEDAGRFVIEDSAVAWAYNIARYGNDIVYATIGVTVAGYGLAIVAAKDRRRALLTGGLVLAGAGVLSLALLLPLGQAVRSFARNDAAATSVVEIISSGFKTQSLVMLGGGLTVAAAAALFGGSSLAVALRSAVRPSADTTALPDAIRERATALRVGGLVGAAVLLIVWPDPSVRVYVTVIGLLAVFMLGMYVLTSDAPAAERMREQARRFSAPAAATEGGGAGEGSVRSWIAAHAGWLRLAGIVVAVGLLLLWPELSVRFLVTLVALALIYLAVIDVAGSRASRGRTTT